MITAPYGLIVELFFGLSNYFKSQEANIYL